MADLVKQLAEQWEGRGAWAILTTLVSVLIATVISKVLDARLKHRYDRDMERFKSRIEQDRLVINTALSSLNAAAAASHPKIVESVETLWDAILKLRDAFPGVNLYADILTREEWCKLPSGPRTGDKIGDFSEREIMRLMKEELADAENARPFVGELIWSLYFVYRAFILRVVTIVEINYRKGSLPYWYEDRGIQQYIRILLTEEEIRIVERFEVGRFQQARALAEARILAEINRVITGHRSADSGLEQANRMLRAVAEVESGEG